MIQYLISALIAALLLGGLAPTQAMSGQANHIIASYSQLQR
jgi:hypothetical protein